MKTHPSQPTPKPKAGSPKLTEVKTLFYDMLKYTLSRLSAEKETPSLTH
ncbi:hypothetical protein [Hufsiella ginkgonis]|uniref:Uncharacterized protein n=1 Tax=Hufsiella ginkgonis TaxID=2695274 RepID=A0A7K1XV32_9SPHI|nr:hypothetical protein [Hufsiella ginkgonis]MXV14830.1 hypothetical protein [Hufsiella ginkgonis]